MTELKFDVESGGEPDVRPRIPQRLWRPRKLRPSFTFVNGNDISDQMNCEIPQNTKTTPVVITFHSPERSRSSPSNQIISDEGGNDGPIVSEGSKEEEVEVIHKAFDFLDNSPKSNPTSNHGVNEVIDDESERMCSNSTEKTMVGHTEHDPNVFRNEYGDENNNTTEKHKVVEHDAPTIVHFQPSNNNEPDTHPNANVPKLNIPEPQGGWWGEETENEWNNNNNNFSSRYDGLEVQGHTSESMSREEREALKKKVRFVLQLTEHIHSLGHTLKPFALLTAMRRLFFETLVVCGESYMEDATKKTFFSHTMMLTKQIRTSPIKKSRLICAGIESPEKFLHCRACETWL